MCDYYERGKSYRERDLSALNYQVTAKKEYFSRNNRSVSPNKFEENTYSRQIDYQDQVDKKIANLRLQKTEDELANKGISPDKTKVQNRRQNKLINRLDKIILEKEKKIMKMKAQDHVEREIEAFKECTFKPKITDSDKRGYSKPRTVSDLEEWDRQRLKKRSDNKLESLLNKYTFKPKLNKETKILASRLHRRGQSVEDRLLKYGKQYQKKNDIRKNMCTNGLFQPRKYIPEFKRGKLDKNNCQVGSSCKKSNKKQNSTPPSIRQHRANSKCSKPTNNEDLTTREANSIITSPSQIINSRRRLKFENSGNKKNLSKKKKLCNSNKKRKLNKRTSKIKENTVSHGEILTAKLNDTHGKNVKTLKQLEEFIGSNDIDNKKNTIAPLALKQIDNDKNNNNSDEQNATTVKELIRLQRNRLFGNFGGQPSNTNNKVEQEQTLSTFKSPDVVEMNDMNLDIVDKSCESISMNIPSLKQSLENKCNGSEEKSVINTIIKKSIELIQKNKFIQSKKNLQNSLYEEEYSIQFHEKLQSFLSSLNNNQLCSFGNEEFEQLSKDAEKNYRGRNPKRYNDIFEDCDDSESNYDYDCQLKVSEEQQDQADIYDTDLCFEGYKLDFKNSGTGTYDFNNHSITESSLDLNNDNNESEYILEKKPQQNNLKTATEKTCDKNLRHQLNDNSIQQEFTKSSSWQNQSSQQNGSTLQNHQILTTQQGTLSSKDTNQKYDQGSQYSLKNRMSSKASLEYRGTIGSSQYQNPSIEHPKTSKDSYRSSSKKKSTISSDLTYNLSLQEPLIQSKGALARCQKSLNQKNSSKYNFIDQPCVIDQNDSPETLRVLDTEKMLLGSTDKSSTEIFPTDLITFDNIPINNNKVREKSKTIQFKRNVKRSFSNKAKLKLDKINKGSSVTFDHQKITSDISKKTQACQNKTESIEQSITVNNKEEIDRSSSSETYNIQFQGSFRDSYKESSDKDKENLNLGNTDKFFFRNSSKAVAPENFDNDKFINFRNKQTQTQMYKDSQNSKIDILFEKQEASTISMNDTCDHMKLKDKFEEFVNNRFDCFGEKTGYGSNHNQKFNSSNKKRNSGLSYFAGKENSLRDRLAKINDEILKKRHVGKNEVPNFYQHSNEEGGVAGERANMMR